MEAKRPWQSKMMWTNIIGGIAMFATASGVDIGLDQNTQVSIVGGILAMINVYLRAITASPISLK